MILPKVMIYMDQQFLLSLLFRLDLRPKILFHRVIPDIIAKNVQRWEKQLTIIQCHSYLFCLFRLSKSKRYYYLISLFDSFVIFLAIWFTPTHNFLEMFQLSYIQLNYRRRMPMVYYILKRFRPSAKQYVLKHFL